MAKYKSRLDRRSKSKTNTVLNIMIAVVVLLIVVVGATILTGNGSDKENASTKVENSDKNSAENSADRDNDSEQKNDENSVSMKEEESSESEKEKDKKKEEEDKTKEEEQEESPEEKESVALDDSSAQIEESSEPNVKRTIVHPDWEPVGTQQSGEHVSSYDTGSVDWQEKEQALSYATGIPQDNMTVWYIEGNGGPQKSIGTITEKGGSTAYRVYLQWNDGQGWQPTKVEELIENDKD
ncbi:YrrS family protein [Bacillus sp. Marseille-Q1617]|uniref:YrrS family protein n=1 Tax=Bacillus sp. Marseille-Q1617 TaxID=2736887 RepID=UPI0020CA5F01|nr:YrrS family protein [Bacillus sp. Marseille-Q1617]